MPMLMIIIDGLTDDPQEILGGKTPLEAAQCTSLDYMRQSGAHGFFTTVPEGFSAESLTCISTLLGVPPQSLPKGRAYAEALSCGVTAGENDAVCRCSLVTIDESGRLLSSCADGIENKAQLCASFAAGFSAPSISFVPMSSYKNLLLIKGGARAVQGTITFAPHENEGEPFEALLPRGGGEICEALCAVAHTAVAEPKDGVTLAMLPWGITKRHELPQFKALHGVEGAAVCATEVMRGIALGMGLELTTPNGTTADSDTDLSAKAQAALRLLKNHEFVLVHINGADELSHRRDAHGKASFLREIDTKLLAPLLKKAPQGTMFLVCSDHSSLCATGGHRGEPQPFVLYGGSHSGGIGEYCGTDAVELLRGKL